MYEETDDFIMYRIDYFKTDAEVVGNPEETPLNYFFIPDHKKYAHIFNRFGIKLDTCWIHRDFIEDCVEIGIVFNDKKVEELVLYLIGLSGILDCHNEFKIEMPKTDIKTIERNGGFVDLYYLFDGSNDRVYDYQTLREYYKYYEKGKNSLQNNREIVVAEDGGMQETHYVYKLYKSLDEYMEKGECYIGITNNIRVRMRQHLKTEKVFEWVQYITVPSREIALAVEQSLLAFNKTHKQLENKLYDSKYAMKESSGIYNDLKFMVLQGKVTEDEFNSLFHINELVLKG